MNCLQIFVKMFYLNYCIYFIYFVKKKITIIKIVAGLIEGSPLMMVQELVPLGSMLAYLLEFPDRVYPNRELKIWAAQIACGMFCFYKMYASLLI